MGLIYQALNKLNGKSYIGQTIKTLRYRKSAHKSNTNSRDCYFYNAIKKYGWDNFQWSVLEDNIEPKDLNEKEIYWIQKLDTFKTGYNSTNGGEQPTQVSEETVRKRKLSRAGYRPSKETIEKIRTSNKGKKRSNKTKKRIIAAKACYWKITDPTGKTFVIRNLAKFCRENNLHQGHMGEVSQAKRKKSKGWQCTKLQKM